MNEAFAKKHSFKLSKLDQAIPVKNVDGTLNSRGSVMHKVAMNIHYKRHKECVLMDVCNIGKADVILGMLWLSQHNPEINWETGEVKMMRCPKMCENEEKKENWRKKQETFNIAVKQDQRF